MANSIDNNRIEQIIKFLKSLNIKSKRFCEVLKTKDKVIINTFNEALTHSSANKKVNYEKLEFFGDAVLRLSASDFINKTFNNLNVGKSSELRSQIVSDEWLSRLGEKINIEQVIIQGPKALGDKSSKNTILAESTEALIGAIYKCFNSIEEVNLWLNRYWEKDAELFLKAPYKFNAKSALQEWCQEKGYSLPVYKILEISKNHGDPKRFCCEIFINGKKKASSFGQSHKKAEKKAAIIVIENILKK